MSAATEDVCIKFPSRDANIPFDPEALSDNSLLLSGLEPSDLNDLLALAVHRPVKARRLVCRKGDPGHELFIVLSGKLKVCTTSGDGKEAILGLIESSEVFGEMALIDGQVRSANVTAVEDSRLLVIHRKDFLPFLEAHPKACMGLLMALSQRLRKMDALVEDLRFLDLKARLAKTLHRLAQEYGRTMAGGGIRIDFRISQEELGSLVGATRENVNKLIRAWVDEGVLETSQSTVILRRPDRLLGQ
jgi:CRP/FNR family transcriptional regulator, cyclic AMP receptor protein